MSGFDKIFPAVSQIVADVAETNDVSLSPAVLRSTAASISGFCADKLVPGRGRSRAPADPQRQRLRQARRSVNAAMATMRRMDGKRIAIRSIAVAGGAQSPATVHRDLMREGIAPRRQARIAGLSRSQRKLVSILDALAPSHGRKAKIHLAALIARIYPKPATARSTPAMRRKRVLRDLAVILTADIGLHPIHADGVIALARGVRWRGFKDILVFIQETGFTRVPVAPKKHADPFIEALQDFEAILELSSGSDAAHAAWRMGNLCSSSSDRQPLKLVCDAMHRDPYINIDEAKVRAWIRGRQQEKPISLAAMAAIEPFMTASFVLAEARRYGRDPGKAIANFIEASNLRVQLEAACSRHERTRLNALLGIAQTLKGLDWEDAYECLDRWRAEPSAIPLARAVEADCSQMESEADEAEALEILGFDGPAVRDLSHLSYHNGKGRQPGRPLRAPPDSPGGV